MHWPHQRIVSKVNEKPTLLIVGKITHLLPPFMPDLSIYEALTAFDQKEALAKLRRFEPGVVLFALDFFSDSFEIGFEILNQILSLAPHTKIIVISEKKERHIAVKALTLGVFDYLVLPAENAVVIDVIKRAIHLSALAKASEGFSLAVEDNVIDGVVMGSMAMQKVWQTIQKVAPSNISILLQGESGTGKEILAHALHQKSDRAKGPFVAINCAAIPETLLESELFGFEKGAFTGAHKLTLGRIERAHQGTLFLDEIGDLPLSLQPKLLRFLQERVIERLGGSAPQALDVRIICATHQHLPTLIQKQAFREDLYYRLSEIAISIPALRERAGDAVVMARTFLTKYSTEFKKPVKRMTEEALQAIHHYHWPGNVRELENRLKRAVVLAEGQQITLEDLDLPEKPESQFPFNLKQVRDKVERESILSAIRYCEGNISKAAELLGISRPTLYNMMEKLNINEELVLV